MDALKWLAFLLLVVSVWVIFSNASWVRPNHRRLFIGSLALLALVVYVWGLLTGAEFSAPRLFGIIFSSLGGVILVLVAFWPKIQNGNIEYLGWALTIGFWWGLTLGEIFGDSEWLQWGVGLVSILANYAFQRLEGKPLSERKGASGKSGANNEDTGREIITSAE